jgi:hypothetical protein
MDTTVVGVMLGRGVGEGVYVGSPGRCVTRMILVGKLVMVGVKVVSKAAKDRPSVVAIAKLPAMIMMDVMAAKMPVSTSLDVLIAASLRDCHSVMGLIH